MMLAMTNKIYKQSEKIKTSRGIQEVKDVGGDVKMQMNVCVFF